MEGILFIPGFDISFIGGYLILLLGCAIMIVGNNFDEEVSKQAALAARA